MYTGSCLCGGVAFEIAGELAPIQVCHCQQCRKAQGTALVTNIPVESGKLHWVSGEALLKSHESSGQAASVLPRVRFADLQLP